jgi:hypothetical protein
MASGMRTAATTPATAGERRLHRLSPRAAKIDPRRNAISGRLLASRARMRTKFHGSSAASWSMKRRTAAWSRITTAWRAAPRML